MDSLKPKWGIAYPEGKPFDKALFHLAKIKLTNGIIRWGWLWLGQVFEFNPSPFGGIFIALAYHGCFASLRGCINDCIDRERYYMKTNILLKIICKSLLFLTGPLLLIIHWILNPVKTKMWFALNFFYWLSIKSTFRGIYIYPLEGEKDLIVLK